MAQRMTYLQAVREAMQEEMRRDERVFVMGEDIRAPLWAEHGFFEEFGPMRVLETPISEAGFVGAAVGAAMTGMRPIVDMTIASLMFCAMDQFVSQAAKARYLFGGQTSVPVVYRAGMMYGGSSASQHSDRPYPMFMGVPGLKVIAPATPSDVKGLLKAAIRDDDPVICFEDVTLWMSAGEVPDGDHIVPLGVADVKRSGNDVTIVSVAGALVHALSAAERLEGEGISAEVVDVRTLVPLDRDTVLASVAKTGRLVIADPAHRTCSAASEIAAIVIEEGFSTLAGPIMRVTMPNVQVPFSPPLERLMLIDADKIVAAVHQALGLAAAPGAEYDPVGQATKLSS
jgi:acetoin:2,6-dichlorophenolindophenol oxidoreductase subunit beta